DVFQWLLPSSATGGPSLHAADDTGARVLDFLADAILRAPALLRLEARRLDRLAKVLHLVERAALVAVDGPDVVERRAAAHASWGVAEKRDGPSFGDQQFGVATWQLDDIALPVRRDVYSVEVVGQLANELNAHDIHNLVWPRVLENKRPVTLLWRS